MTVEATATAQLTPEQIEAWHRDGFLRLDRIADPNTVAELRVAYQEVLDAEEARDGGRLLGGLTRQVIMPSKLHPTFASNPALEAGIAIATQLFDAEVASIFEMLIYKPAGHPHKTPWHQDAAYNAMPFAAPGAPFELDSIHFWLPLDDVDGETGCMQFIPGRHTGELMEHKVFSGDPFEEDRLLALVDPENQLDLSTVVVAPLPAGGCTMHNPGTPHFTGPNRSANRPRRSYIFNVSSLAAIERHAARKG